MKTRFLVMMAMAAVMLSSCSFNGFNTVVPSRERVKKEYKLGSFDQIETSTAVNVVYTNSNKQSVMLDVPKNMEEFVSVKVKGKKLNVSFNGLHNINGDHKTTLYVSGYKVHKFETSSAGNIYIKGAINYNGEVAVVTSSAGSVYIEGPVKANTMYLESSSAGNVKAEAPVNVTNLNVSASSAGNIKVENVTAHTVNAKASSAGNITIAGKCKVVNTDKSSAGGIDIKNLKQD